MVSDVAFIETLLTPENKHLASIRNVSLGTPGTMDVRLNVSLLHVVLQALRTNSVFLRHLEW